MNSSLHVFWANLLLREILRGNGTTEYSHKTGPVWWGVYSGMPYFASITDCSGFLNALIKKSYDITNYEFAQWFETAKPYASTYYKMILKNRGFVRIKNIMDAHIGDFISVYYPISTRSNKNDNTGHIMMINTKPIQIKPIMPIIPGYSQWLVGVLDQTSTPHGKLDTRIVGRDIVTGLGLGYARIYTDSNGEIRGYAWSTSRVSEFVDRTENPIVIGRLNIRDVLWQEN